MSKHIKFDGFDCPKLQYVKASDSWVCLRFFVDLKDVEECFNCKFDRQLKREALICQEIKGQNSTTGTRRCHTTQTSLW